MILLWIVLVLLLLAALFVLSVRPGTRRDGFPFQNALIAHRGLHGNGIPENSLAAFAAAAKKGNMGAELDVQLTKDGKLVVFHDGDLRRMCGTDKTIVGSTFRELQEYPLANSDQHIPLFRDVLQALKGIPLICEIKVSEGADYQKLSHDAYEMLKDYEGPYCIESFHPGAVKWFKDHHPEVIRGQLAYNFLGDSQSDRPFWQKFLLTHMMANWLTQPDFIAYRFQDTGTLGYRISTKLFHAHSVAWTPRGPREIEQAKQQNFETLIFEVNPRV